MNFTQAFLQECIRLALLETHLVFKNEQQHLDFCTTSAKRLRTMMRHVVKSLNKTSPSPWTKILPESLRCHFHGGTATRAQAEAAPGGKEKKEEEGEDEEEGGDDEEGEEEEE